MTTMLSAQTARAFDEIASTYDDTFERNPIVQSIRPIITQSLLRHFHKGQHVLDINCGTGTDAIILAQHGIRVTAIDVSPNMIELTRSKSIRGGVGEMIHAEVMNYEHISSFGEHAFDGAFSNFGGLNCTQQPEMIVKNVFTVLKHGSPFIACVMNRVCLWEITSFLIRGKLNQAFRRFRKNGVEAHLGNTSIHTWYCSPRQFAKKISPWFTVKRMYGITILSPSPNSNSFVKHYPQLTSRLLAMDNSLRDVYPWYALGDHFVLEAQRALT